MLLRFFVPPMLALCTSPIICQMSHDLEPKPGIGHTVRVPFEYERPEKGSFELYYESGRPFDPAKLTVLVIADGQQYYVRKDLVAPLQEELFGDRFNVVGIIGRGFNRSIIQRIKQGDSVNWPIAYEFLKSDEWIEDIESVRKNLVGPSGKIALYGRSGGGLLVHQYLARHPEHVRSVFTQAAVNRFLDAEFGLESDTFWNEIGKDDSTLQGLLLDAIARKPAERARIILLLQRQNFFVPSAQIAAERARLIHALHSWDETVISQMSKAYQVDQVLPSVSTEDPASSVRVFELFAPVLDRKMNAMNKEIDPDFEVGKMFGAPVFRLLEEQSIAPPKMDFCPAHGIKASVYMLAGRFDHTADYRSQIALATEYPNHRLLLLADNHDFPELAKTGLYPLLIQSALLSGTDGPREAGVETKLRALTYHEY